MNTNYINLSQYKKLLEDINGIDERNLKRIDEKSSYNNNYYFFQKNNIHYMICGISDDDTETEWWWCVDNVRLLIGYSSSISECGIIKSHEKPYT